MKEKLLKLGLQPEAFKKTCHNLSLITPHKVNKASGY